MTRFSVAEREASVSGTVRVAQQESVDTEDEPETDDTGSTSGKAPSPSNPLLQERSNCEELRHVVCHLETKELWDKFNELGTEMIITKTGRCVKENRNLFFGPTRYTLRNYLLVIFYYFIVKGIKNQNF